MVTDSGKVASFTLLLDDDNFMKSETEIVIDNVEILLVIYFDTKFYFKTYCSNVSFN